MSFIQRVLEEPRYGWARNNALYVPTTGETLRHFAHRLNVFRDPRNWAPASSWFWTLALAPFLLVFVFQFFSLPLLLLGLVYALIGVGTHGTIYFHRYSTHRAFRFRSKFTRFVVANLIPKVIVDELYVVSHHVHHAMTEIPGDPYNAHGGFLYCFLADVNHQPLRRDLSERDYAKVMRLVSHTGKGTNSYSQYRRWGSLAHPLRTTLSYFGSWIFWYAAFFLIGGHALATALFGCMFLWALGVRTFNYDGHGRGVDRRREGIDLNRKDLSINQLWPGLVAGEWHNNHHLFPRSARTGFQAKQFDGAWLFIALLRKLRLIDQVIDDRPAFLALLQAPVEGTARDHVEQSA